MKKFCTACRTLDKSLSYLEIFLVVLCVSSLIIGEIMVAVLRQSSRINLSWIEELLKYVVIWVGLLGASLASRTGQHISIEVVSRFTTAKFKRYLLALTSLATTIIAIYLCMAGFQYLQEERIEYLSTKGVQSHRYITLENIFIYRCPNSIVKKRQAVDQEKMKVAGETVKLQKAVETFQHDDSYEIVRLSEQVQESIEQIQKSDWKKDWIAQQWKNHWQKEWQTYWQENQASIIENQPILPRSKVNWQNRWISQFWLEHGKAQADLAWEEDGQTKWEEVADDYYSQDEFRQDWQNDWIEKIWQTTWQAIMEKAWQDFGQQQCLENQTREQWILQQWKQVWQKEWQNVQNNHQGYTYREGICPICQEMKIPEPLTIPRWPLLLILPFALAIIAWRFALLTLEALFLGRSEATHTEEN